MLLAAVHGRPKRHIADTPRTLAGHTGCQKENISTPGIYPIRMNYSKNSNMKTILSVTRYREEGEMDVADLEYIQSAWTFHRTQT
jgi:hypothetical protein